MARGCKLQRPLPSASGVLSPAAAQTEELTTSAGPGSLSDAWSLHAAGCMLLLLLAEGRRSLEVPAVKVGRKDARDPPLDADTLEGATMTQAVAKLFRRGAACPVPLSISAKRSLNEFVR